MEELQVKIFQYLVIGMKHVIQVRKQAKSLKENDDTTNGSGEIGGGNG